MINPSSYSHWQPKHSLGFNLSFFHKSVNCCHSPNPTNSVGWVEFQFLPCVWRISLTVWAMYCGQKSFAGFSLVNCIVGFLLPYFSRLGLLWLKSKNIQLATCGGPSCLNLQFWNCCRRLAFKQFEINFELKLPNPDWLS